MLQVSRDSNLNMNKCEFTIYSNSKNDFNIPFSIRLPKTFLNISNNIGPKINPNTPNNLKPAYIPIKVNIGCKPISELTNFGSIICLITAQISQITSTAIATGQFPINAKYIAHGTITKPAPSNGNKSTKPITSAIVIK